MLLVLEPVFQKPSPLISCSCLHSQATHGGETRHRTGTGTTPCPHLSRAEGPPSAPNRASKGFQANGGSTQGKANYPKPQSWTISPLSHCLQRLLLTLSEILKDVQVVQLHATYSLTTFQTQGDPPHKTG